MKIINIVNLYLINNDQVLLIFKSTGSKKYYAPGGKIENMKNLASEAIREFKEETNLDIKNANFVCINVHHFKNKKVIIYSFKANEYSGKLINQGPEGEVQWIKISKINELEMLNGDREVLNDIINNEKKSEYEFIY